jgi:hypothetical protein
MTLRSLCQTKTPASLLRGMPPARFTGLSAISAMRIYKSMNCCMSTSRCGISAYENPMQHLITDPTPEAALPVIWPGGHPACAIGVLPMIAQPGGRNRRA